MAEIINIANNGLTRVSIESTFGAGDGTKSIVYPRAGVFIEPKQARVRLQDERARNTENQKGLKGLKSWSGKLLFDMKPDTDQLLAAATPGTTPQGKLLKAIMGGEASAAGSTVASAASATSITVASGHGSRFPKGTWVAVGVSGVLYPRKVINRSTDTLTLYPALPGTPASGQLVVNSYTYYSTQANAQSLCVEHARVNVENDADYDHQFRFNGGTGDIAFKLESGGVAQFEVDLRGTSWTGPEDLSLLPASTADDSAHGSPFVVRETTTLWQLIATTTAVHVPMRKLDVKFNASMVHLPELGGSEGKTGVRRARGDAVFASAEVTKLRDPTFRTYYADDEDTFLCAIVESGSGTDKRFLVLELGTCYQLEEPVESGDGDLIVCKHMLESLEDGTVTSPDTDLARAQFRVALI